MARQTCRTCWEQAQRRAAAVLAQGSGAGAGRTQAPASDPLEEEEPMNRYIHTIPCAAARCAAQGECREVQASLERVLEGMAYQNQLLADLLGAVNGLTAALLSVRNRTGNS